MLDKNCILKTKSQKILIRTNNVKKGLYSLLKNQILQFLKTASPYIFLKLPIDSKVPDISNMSNRARSPGGIPPEPSSTSVPLEMPATSVPLEMPVTSVPLETPVTNVLTQPEVFSSSDSLLEILEQNQVSELHRPNILPFDDLTSLLNSSLRNIIRRIAELPLDLNQIPPIFRPYVESYRISRQFNLENVNANELLQASQEFVNSHVSLSSTTNLLSVNQQNFSATTILQSPIFTQSNNYIDWTLNHLSTASYMVSNNIFLRGFVAAILVSSVSLAFNTAISSFRQRSNLSSRVIRRSYNARVNWTPTVFRPVNFGSPRRIRLDFPKLPFKPKDK